MFSTEEEVLNIFKVLKAKVEIKKVHNVDWLFINNVQTLLLTETQVKAINDFYNFNNDLKLNFSDDSEGLKRRIYSTLSK